MSVISDQLQTVQLQHGLAESHASQRQTCESSYEGCAASCSSMLQPQSSKQLQDMGKDIPDTIARVRGRRLDVLAKEDTKFPKISLISWQQKQHGQTGAEPSYAASALLPQLQLQPELLQVIKKVVETAVVSAVTVLACSEDQQHSPSAAAAAAADIVPQPWLLLPMSPVLSPYGGSGAVSGTAPSFDSSCTQAPAAISGPAPPPPTATPRRPAPVRRRTFNCMPQFTPAGSVPAAATAPGTPNAAGRMLDSPWAVGNGAMFAGFPQHLLPNSLARASSTGDISAYPAARGQAARRNSSSTTTSCCSRLSECSSGFASSRSSSDGGSTSSSPLAMPTPLALDACGRCGHLQPQAAALSPRQLLLLQPLQLHPPSVPVRQPSPPQDPRSTTGATPGKTSPRIKFVCPGSPGSPVAVAPAIAPAGRHNSRFAPVAPPRTLLQRGACGGAELRASVGRFHRHSTSLSGLAGEALSLSDGAIAAAASVLDGAGLGGGACSRLRWSGRSLDGRALGGDTTPSLPAGGVASDGGGAAAFAAAMAAVAVGATGMAGQ